MATKYVLILDRGNATEVTAIQKIVKENSNGWWHQFENVWIVNGRSAAKWRDLAKAGLVAGPSSILVLKMPDSSIGVRWSFVGPNSKKITRWLHDNY